MTDKWIESLVTNLASVKLDNVFNPYSDVCQLNDQPNARDIRTLNLTFALSASVQQGSDSIWFGREFGYRGGRRTGLSLTDEGNLGLMRQVLHTSKIMRATRGDELFERTATIVWGLIQRLPAPPILWNAFPLHSHEPGNPMSNRAHSAAERRVTAWTIEELVSRIRPKKLVAIGNDAAKALVELGIKFEQVRHPSYGGQREFISKMEALYGLDPLIDQPDLLSSRRTKQQVRIPS